MLHPIRHAQLQQLRCLKNQTPPSSPALSDIGSLLAQPDISALLPKHRDRFFTPERTLSMFITQTLDADHSCQKAVNTIATRHLKEGLTPCSTATGAYCRARMRLPAKVISHLVSTTGQRISAESPAAWRWRGRPVRLVDGTTASLPDTQANQEAYPQPVGQKPGLGFPLCRLVGLMCLGSGVVLNAAMESTQGKGTSEQSLLRSMLDTLQAGDVLLGDAFFGTYFLLGELQARQVDAVFEQYGARRRSTNFRLGQSLGERDHLMVLTKPRIRPDWMSEQDYAKAPDTLTIRELSVGGKLLITTLLCPRQTTKEELKALYRSRWQVELDFRNLKTTLGMETLRGRSPQMVEKEIWVYLLAYNLIREAMVSAAKLAELCPRQLSFKHGVQLWVSWGNGDKHDWEKGESGLILLLLMGQRRVGKRPGRIEPRAVKRRPKPYPLLTKTRKTAKEEILQNGHPTKLK